MSTPITAGDGGIQAGPGTDEIPIDGDQPPGPGPFLVVPPPLSASRMGRRLTTPFARGADTLAVPMRPAGANLATVDSYGFDDHVARFGQPPAPRYVLATTVDLVAASVVSVTYVDEGAAPQTVTVPLPPRTLAGTSMLVPLPGSATLRVTQVGLVPGAPDGQVVNALTLTALLGNLAKLLWVIGAERDVLRGQAAHTLAQRHLPAAEGLSLDLIGVDLGVPRFPPLPYSFDAATIALYHLDDTAKTAPVVADATTGHPGRVGHPGQLTGSVQLAGPGRYGRAFSFVPGSWVEVGTSSEFDLPAGASATIECFVRPDPGATDGVILTRHPAPTGTGVGWVLAVGDFGRGVPLNLRFTLSDGNATPPEVFADVSLPADTFTHVAVTIDAPAERLTLFLNGQSRATASLHGRRPIVNTAPLRIGAAVGGFRGAIDEVRISSAVRTTFAPTLGEADEHYRRRLTLFRRWTLPTPANLTAILNELAGPIGGQPDALTVNDSNASLVRGTRLVRVRPVSLRPGECIDSAGRRRVVESDVVGTAAAEDTFDPAFLFRYDRAQVDFGSAGSRTPGADAHLVQIGLVDRLDRLVALAGAATSPPGRLLIDGAFDPRAGDLRATGRAVMLGHSTVAPGRLAALAQRAGFDFVCYRAGASLVAPVYAAAAPGDYFVIDVNPAGAGPIDIDLGASAALTLRPALPGDAFVAWHTVPDGPGRGSVVPDTGPSTPQRTATLHATAAGTLIVKADVSRGRHTVSATRVLRVGLGGLGDGSTVSADGTLGTPVSSVDVAGAFFDPAFLVRHNDGRVNYGPAENNHLMQPAVAELLDALLARLPATGQLSVTGAFNPNGDNAAKEGRELILRHSTLTADQLAPVAFAVGFGHLQRAGADLFVRQAPGQLVVVHGPVASESNGVITLDEGSTVELTVVPVPASLTAPAVTPAVLGWSSGSFDTAEVALGSTTKATTTLTATAAGLAWVQASYLVGDAPAPYTFQVRLRPELDGPSTVITKEQHDLIMNVLNALHPVGVEVNTALIRSHVVEVQGDLLLQANPEYTYPKFRVRGVLPPQVRRAGRG